MFLIFSCSLFVNNVAAGYQVEAVNLVPIRKKRPKHLLFMILITRIVAVHEYANSTSAHDTVLEHRFSPTRMPFTSWQYANERVKAEAVPCLQVGFTL